MPISNLLLPFSLFVLAGCAAYQLPPLPAQHPANPEAMAAPEQPPSKTLAYGPSDIPSSQPASRFAQEGQGYRPSDKEVQQDFAGTGKVIAVVPSSGQIVVEHGEIKGFMEAMTMGYRVEPPSLLSGLKPGDEVRFTIDVPKKAIVKIEKGAAPVATMSPQQGARSPGAEADRRETVVGEGKVIATVPSASQVVVEHGEIEGFMEAMTMGYRVEPPSLLRELKPGDEVRFTIDVPKKAIVKIEKLK